jgi:lysophospholipase L1-like esterase
MKLLVSVYLLVVHLALGYVLWDVYYPQLFPGTAPKESQLDSQIGAGSVASSVPAKLDRHYYTMLSYHIRSVKMVPDDALIFIGDSLVLGLCVNAVSPLSINYGIGGDSSAGVLNRILYYYPAMESARGVVLSFGTNDHKSGSVADSLANIERILEIIPPDVPVMISSVIPVDESKQSHLEGRADFVAELNLGLRRIADQRDMVIFVDNDDTFDTDGDGRLDDGNHLGDGIHLNRVGSEKWAANLRAGLKRLPVP